MIILTGGAGFIGSAFLWRLNEAGIDDICVIDHLGTTDKWKNLVKRRYREYLPKGEFLELIRAGTLPFSANALIHLGACSSTTERDADYLWHNNVRYSQEVIRWAVGRGLRVIYASSAATYGNGAQGFSDDEGRIPELRPINMYGYSKQALDLWVLREGLRDRVTGIKFFNVFGPNEYHKGEMRSMVHKAVEQITQEGRVRLFKSLRPAYEDGGQKRDFIYIKDCVEVLFWLLTHPQATGIFNLGTGRARTWNDLIRSVFKALGKEPQIEYISMPPTLERQYQYFTEARMDRLASVGCPLPDRSLEKAVADYVTGYLMTDDPYL